MKKIIFKLGFVALSIGLSFNLMAQNYNMKNENILNQTHEFQRKGDWQGAFDRAKDLYEKNEHPAILREMILSCINLNHDNKCHGKIDMWMMFSSEDGDGVGMVLWGEKIMESEDFYLHQAAHGYGLIAKHLLTSFNVKTLGDVNWMVRADELTNQSFEKIKNDERFNQEKLTQLIEVYMGDISQRADKWYVRQIRGESVVLSVSKERGGGEKNDIHLEYELDEALDGSDLKQTQGVDVGEINND